MQLITTGASAKTNELVEVRRREKVNNFGQQMMSTKQPCMFLVWDVWMKLIDTKPRDFAKRLNESVSR